MTSQLHPAVRALGLAVGGLVLLVGGFLAAYSGLKSLAQAGMPAPPAPMATPPAAQNYIANPDAARRRVRLLVKQSHGDWARLSADDRRLLNSVTGGHGRDMLRAMAKEQTAREPQAARRPRRKE